MTLPNSMHAARIHDYGTPDVFRTEEVPVPVPKGKEILVRIRASSVNPVDCKIRAGSMRGLIWKRPPLTIGMDFSGEVVACGPQASKFKVGDEVYASPDHKRDGTYAQYMTVPEAQVALKPSNLTHEEAASIPLVGLTAWACLVDHVRVQSGQRIFVQAGSGGVGTFGVQLAAALGAHVISTCSGRNVELVESLGAAQVIDYTKQSILEGVDAPLDGCLDAINDPEATLHMFKHCRKGARVAGITSGIPEAAKKYGYGVSPLIVGAEIAGIMFNAMRHGVSYRSALRASDGHKLAKITELIEAGKIRAVVDKVFPLEELDKAHTYSETGRARGKIVISVA